MNQQPTLCAILVYYTYLHVDRMAIYHSVGRLWTKVCDLYLNGNYTLQVLIDAVTGRFLCACRLYANMCLWFGTAMWSGVSHITIILNIHGRKQIVYKIYTQLAYIQHMHHEHWTIFICTYIHSIIIRVWDTYIECSTYTYNYNSPFWRQQNDFLGNSKFISIDEECTQRQNRPGELRWVYH